MCASACLCVVCVCVYMCTPCPPPLQTAWPSFQPVCAICACVSVCVLCVYACICLRHVLHHTKLPSTLFDLCVRIVCVHVCECVFVCCVCMCVYVYAMSSTTPNCLALFLTHVSSVTITSIPQTPTELFFQSHPTPSHTNSNTLVSLHVSI